ncbi:hypothetical protein [Xylophilus sp. Leaf220]|uniref:hypothetical protein n=1 Tax=Xylophilus sp. Leaf220 TaxID=1735686 RepID=UPI0006FC5069|nr:hypothetical protein [Xylophilus sp. Leaf220]KQM80262.1 hypothetical protein ASE76_03715 [Xylophilus sp. Leaf220]
MSDGALPEGLAAALLLTLAEKPAGEAASVPWLGKRLQREASVVMRTLAMMGNARIGSRQGPGWVDVAHDGERWMVRLLAPGAEAVRQLVEAHGGDDGVPDAPAEPDR